MLIKDLLKRNKILARTAKIVKSKKRYLQIKYNYIGTLKNDFEKKLGYNLNLDNPKTFNEKIQYIKVYYHNTVLTTCADKYAVRQYIKERVGEELLIDIYRVYESIDDINLEELPDKFVLKPNHSSQRVIICSDKNKMDWPKECKKMRKWLKENYYYEHGEWQYKNIPPKIICEKLLQENIDDYKVFCFNGEPKFTQVITSRKKGHYNTNYYDLEWNLMEIDREDHGKTNYTISRPLNYDKMIEISKVIAKEFPFVRMDFYEVEGKLFFGETTFSPANGMIKFMPEKYDIIFGDYLKLPECRNNEV